MAGVICAVLALATVAIFSFEGAWNDYIGPVLSLSNNQMYTLQIGLTMFKSTSDTVAALDGGIDRRDAPHHHPVLRFPTVLHRGCGGHRHQRVEEVTCDGAQLSQGRVPSLVHERCQAGRGWR